MGGFTGKSVFKKTFEAITEIPKQRAEPKDLVEEEKQKSLERKKKGRRSLLYRGGEAGVRADTLGGG
jgi:hypothetical protein